MDTPLLGQAISSTDMKPWEQQLESDHRLERPIFVCDTKIANTAIN